MITINDIKYEIIEDNRDSIDTELLKEKLTDFYDEYDYIVGDWAYGKLRLKGFSDKDTKNHNSINDSAQIKKYIKEYCAYGCKYFILKRIDID